MTKLLLSAFLITIFPLTGLACKPRPMPECIKRTDRVNLSHFEGLIIQVEEYQKILDGSITPPTHTDSCFNNHFATHFGRLFKEELVKEKGKTCKDQIAQVKQSILKLINPESPENKSVSSPAMKKLLKKNAKKIKIGLVSLP